MEQVKKIDTREHRTSLEIVRQIVEQFVADNTWGAAPDLNKADVERIRLAIHDVGESVLREDMVNNPSELWEA